MEISRYKKVHRIACRSVPPTPGTPPKYECELFDISDKIATVRVHQVNATNVKGFGVDKTDDTLNFEFKGEGICRLLDLFDKKILSCSEY